jgi:pSer/pThr/pTyr-binding forkhead associated (FHA) protein
MPRFTITRDGKPIGQVDAHGDRIELGSARTCQVLIDDLLISLKQAAFVRSSTADNFHVEAVSRVPAFSLDGQVVESPVEVRDGAVLTIEGYEIAIAYLPGEVVNASASAPAPAAGGQVRSYAPAVEQPLPPPLEPELPPPLEASQPKIAEVTVTAPLAAPPSTPKPDNADMDRTVFVRRVGKLVATAGPLNGQAWDLKSGETRIGRESGQNDIVIRFDAQGNVDNSISRRHASVHVIGDRIFVEDSGSAAGTFVNGSAVASRQRVEVRSQDLIEIRSSRESTLLRIELASTPSPSAPSPAPVPQPIPIAAEPPPVRTPAPIHDAPRQGDFGAEEPPVVRRRRRESAAADNPFVPLEEPRSGGKIPKWGWIAAGAGIILLIVIVLLIAL